MLGNFLNQRLEAAQEERQRKEEMAHAERMKALEMGRSLPDVELARAKAEAVRARAEAGRAIVATVIGGLVALGTGGIGIGATAVVLDEVRDGMQLPALAIIWVCCAVVGVAPAAVALLTSPSWRWRFRKSSPDSFEVSPAEGKKLMTAIQE